MSDVRSSARNMPLPHLESFLIWQVKGSARDVPLAERLGRVSSGSSLTKYNMRDGKPVERWVFLDQAAGMLSWMID